MDIKKTNKKIIIILTLHIHTFICKICQQINKFRKKVHMLKFSIKLTYQIGIVK